MSCVGIVLAAGKGKRFGGADTGDKNKTAAEFLGKPLVSYGVELFNRTCETTLVVVGTAKESVISALSGLKFETALQTETKGTGDAVRVAVLRLKELNYQPKVMIVGYGDHMMFYTDGVVLKLVEMIKNGAVVSMVSTTHEEPDKLAWGRVITNDDGQVIKIVEQKDATEKERQVTLLNAGFYAFDFAWASEALNRLQPSVVTGEYYLTDLIGMAVLQGRAVVSLTVPFEQVGFGVNTQEELDKSQKLKEQIKGLKKG